MSIRLLNLLQGLLTMPIVGFQAFDPGVALPRAAGEAVAREFLRYFGENVTVVWGAPHALLDLNGGDIHSKIGLCTRNIY